MAGRHLIVTGTIAFDHIMDLPSRFGNYIMADQIHMLNISFNAQGMRKEMGGTGGNIAYTLALLGLDPMLLASAGSDFNTEYRQRLEKSGVNCGHVQVHNKELSATGFCITDQDDNQIWAFSPNASRHTTKLKIPSSKDSFVVISPSGPAGVNHFINQCHQLKIPYLYDPAFAIPELTKNQLLKGIHGAAIVIGNDYEINLTKKKTGWDTKQLVAEGRILITTLGSKGSQIEYQKAISHIPTAKLKSTIDPTGAGDAYRAGFLAGYLRNLPLETCGRMGSLAAAYTVEKYGTTTHRFTINQFQARFYQNYAEKLVW